jgi:hypothetical protein
MVSVDSSMKIETYPDHKWTKEKSVEEVLRAVSAVFRVQER